MKTRRATGRSWLAKPREFLPDCLWIAPAVQNSPHPNGVAALVVKNGVGEPLGQQARKIEAFGEIIARGRKNADGHFFRWRSCCFAVSQSMNASFPCLTRFARSRRTSPCHAGDSNCSSSRVKSRHSVSITRSFSAVVIFSNGKVTSIFVSKMVGATGFEPVHSP
jgi:hypothetical protein